jgi:hypothetical protein
MSLNICAGDQLLTDCVLRHEGRLITHFYRFDSDKLPGPKLVDRPLISLGCAIDPGTAERNQWPY